MSDTYKPTEHGGLKADGTPDKRVGTGEFAQGKVDPVEAGKQGGQTGGSTGGSDSSSGGSGAGQFAHGKVDPVEAGKKGGSS
ncbi:uncharacterized protein PAC_14530 [Phialocephala subalpina]|uniref:Uncharacterized protein n=1 Tax=Phialocephala subalpina TaxID=576137 RepID=A0A1L7XHX8_9HELO|nr:uncharacterized protein PAC_14530 [Phialocephala subalpina]